MAASDFSTAMRMPGTIVLDVRTPAEFAGGHLLGAVEVAIAAARMGAAYQEPGRVGMPIASDDAKAVEIASRRFALPFQCPCCGAAPDTELTVPVTRIKGRPVAEDG